MNYTPTVERPRDGLADDVMALDTGPPARRWRWPWELSPRRHPVQWWGSVALVGLLGIPAAIGLRAITDALDDAHTNRTAIDSQTRATVTATAPPPTGISADPPTGNGAPVPPPPAPVGPADPPATDSVDTMRVPVPPPVIPAPPPPPVDTTAPTTNPPTTTTEETITSEPPQSTVDPTTEPDPTGTTGGATSEPPPDGLAGGASSPGVPLPDPS